MAVRPTVAPALAAAFPFLTLAVTLAMTACTGVCSSPTVTPHSTQWATGEVHVQPCSAWEGTVIDVDRAYWELPKLRANEQPWLTNCDVAGRLVFKGPQPSFVDPSPHYTPVEYDECPPVGICRSIPLEDVTAHPGAAPLPDLQPTPWGWTFGAFAIPCAASPPGTIAFDMRIYAPLSSWPRGIQPDCHRYATLVQMAFDPGLGYAPLLLRAADGRTAILQRSLYQSIGTNCA
jgi:hypothetical protein